MHLALFGTRRAQNPRERPPPRRPRRRLSILSFAYSPPPKRRDAAPARACFVVKKKKDDKKYTPGRDERVFSIDAPAVRSGRRRVRVVVEIEALFARRGQTGHSLRYSFSSSKVVVESRRPKHLKCCCGEISLLLDESVQIARIF